MQMGKYEELEIEVVYFDAKDVITASLRASGLPKPLFVL